MNIHHFTFCGADLRALPSGALHWPAGDLLVVSDLHFGKAARQAVQGGALLPPYETRDTLAKLDADIRATAPARVICLGDSFDRAEASAHLDPEDRLWITQLQAGRDWTWIEGNHDPGPVALGGTHRAEVTLPPLMFRHIAAQDPDVPRGEVSGHYHPKARLRLRGRTLSAPCFLVDDRRLILPAYGAYTGGLDCTAPVLRGLMDAAAMAILTGTRAQAIPMPR